MKLFYISRKGAIYSINDERLEISEELYFFSLFHAKTQRAQRRFDNSLLLIPKITQTSLVMFIY